MKGVQKGHPIRVNAGGMALDAIRARYGTICHMKARLAFHDNKQVLPDGSIVEMKIWEQPGIKLGSGGSSAPQ